MMVNFFGNVMQKLIWTFVSIYCLCGRAGNNRFELIQQSKSNQIPIEFDLFDHLYYKLKQFTNI